MGEWLSDVFPQHAGDDSGGDGPSRTPRTYGPQRHRMQDGVEVRRVEALRSITERDGVVDVNVDTAEYRIRLIQTHETEMYQYARTGGVDEDHIRVGWFAPGILRVRYGECDKPDPMETFMAIDERMFTGEPEHVSCRLEEMDGGFGYRAGGYVLEIDQSPFRLRVRDEQGRVRWEQKKRDLFTADVIDLSELRTGNSSSRWESFDLRERERILGLGERFDGVVRNGRTVDFRNKDALGTSSTRTYINVPFAVSSQGYGVFVNSTSNLHWEIGTHDHSSFTFAADGDRLDYFIILGDTPGEILQGYHKLTGAPRMPPIWSFGLWLSRNSYVSWDVVFDVVAESTRRDIPFDVINLDTAWFKEDWNCDLEFSPERFAEPEARMQELRDQGVHICLWQYNFIPNRQDNPRFKEAIEGGYYVTGSDGRPFTYDDEAQGSWLDELVIDFTNAEANAWYQDKIRTLVGQGASAIKVDFGEGVPDEGRYRGLSGSQMHNLYALVYNAAIAKATHDVSGEWIIWARSGTAGSHRYPLHWGGDSQCSWAGLAGTLKGALSLGVSGFPFFSHDIGGFIGRPDEELYIRWAQFGLLSSHARTHGVGDDNPREPWTFGETALEVFRAFSHLRYQLLAYLVGTSQSSICEGKPVVRHLSFEYPDDDTVWTIEDQYFLGDAFLVVPILRPMASYPLRRFYLPQGRWYNFWTGEATVSLGEWREETVVLDRIPIFVRAGAVIPWVAYRSRTGNTIDGLERVDVYAGGKGAFSVETATGSCSINHVDGKTRVEASGVFEDPVIRVIE